MVLLTMYAAFGDTLGFIGFYSHRNLAGLAVQACCTWKQGSPGTKRSLLIPKRADDNYWALFSIGLCCFAPI